MEEQGGPDSAPSKEKSASQQFEAPAASLMDAARSASDFFSRAATATAAFLEPAVHAAGDALTTAGGAVTDTATAAVTVVQSAFGGAGGSGEEGGPNPPEEKKEDNQPKAEETVDVGAEKSK